MSTMKTTFRLTALAVALMTAFGPALADEAEVTELIKPDSSVSLGIGNWSGDRHQQGIYDGMREKGAYGLLDADIIKRDDPTGTWYTLKAQNMGLENRELRIEVLRQGNIGGFFEYNKTPRDNPWTFNTGLQGIGTSGQIVSGAGVNARPKRQVELGTVREMLNGGFYKNILPGLDFKLDFKNEEKTGTRHWSRGSAAEFVAEPIDSTIRQLETILQYSGTKLQLSGGYYGSWYDQNNGGVVSVIGNGAAANTRTFLSQPLSNQAHQAFLDGGYNFTPTTRGTFKVSYSRATQDETFPTNGLVTALANSPRSFDGRVDTTLIQLGLTSRPIPKLSLNANLRYHEVDDKTSVNQYINSQVGFNTPHSFTKTSGKLEGTYRLPQNFSLTGGVDYSSQNRSVPTRGQWLVPYRTELDEATYRLQLRRSFDDNLNGSIAYLYSDRKGSAQIPATQTPIAVNESRIAPMHIADRQRDKLRAKIDWEPLERLSLQFAIEGSRDKYDQNSQPWGLKDGDAWLTSLDASYTFSDDWKLSAWLSHDETASNQDVPPGVAGQRANKVKLEETTNSIGLGLLGKVTSKFSFGADLEWLRSITKHNQNLSITAFTATFQPLPDIENRLTRIKLKGIYAVAKHSDIRFDLIHERWHTDDWTWTAAGGAPYCYTSCTGVDGTTLIASPTQNSTFAGLRYIYKFQ